MRSSLRDRWLRPGRAMLLCAALLSVGAVVAAPTAAQAAPETPACAWSVESRPPQSNAALPDTNATYWITSYTYQPGLQIVLGGTYPDARYTSLTTYDDQRNLFSVNGVDSGISDFQIAPDAGSLNPWQQTASAGGNYTVTLKENPTAAEPNVLPLAPTDAVAGQTGYLILRLYLPASDPSTVPLPNMTFVQDGVSVPVPTCPSTTTSATTTAAAGKDVGAKLATLPVTAAASRSVDFAKALTSNLGGFPSSANGYLGAIVTPPLTNQVVVIRGKAATHPAGPHPAPWPSTSVQLRYWSMCSNVAVLPFPVVVNGTDPGCRSDDETTLDASGYYTYVVGTEAQRAQIEAIPGVTFVPFSADRPHTPHILLLRNMLGDAFPQSVQNVPDMTAASAKQVMGEYYPVAAMCPLATAVASPASCLAS
jgi:hypothetical protein